MNRGTRCGGTQARRAREWPRRRAAAAADETGRPAAIPSRHGRAAPKWRAGPAKPACRRKAAPRRSAASPPLSSFAPAQETMEYLAKPEITKGVLHVGDQTPPRMHARIGHIFKVQGYPRLARQRWGDAMPE